MAHVFESEPDSRQGGDIKPRRFRPQYRALSDAEKALHDAIKGKAAELETLFEQARELRTPKLESIAFTLGDEPVLLEGAALSLDTDYFGEGMKSLELAVMWTVKGLTA
jgi:hypothetical protein